MVDCAGRYNQTKIDKKVKGMAKPRRGGVHARRKKGDKHEETQTGSGRGKGAAWLNLLRILACAKRSVAAREKNEGNRRKKKRIRHSKISRKDATTYCQGGNA